MSTSEFRRSNDVVFEMAGKRAVLLNSTGLEMITLNPTGTLVWQELTEPRRLDDLVSTLQVTHPDVEKTRLATDVVAFLEELIASGLVHRHAPS